MPVGERTCLTSEQTDLVRDPALIEATPPPELAFRRKVSLIDAIRSLASAWEMVTTLTERELRIRYKQAVLGVAWALLQPVILIFTLTTFIGKLAKIDTDYKTYALFAVCGLVPWTFFASAVGQGGMSLLQNLQLINKINCPREVFPLAMVGVAAVDTITSMLAVIVLFAIHTTMPHAAAFVWAVPLILIEIFFAMGISLLVSSLVVHIRDIRHVLPVVIQMGIIFTPVMWPFDGLSHGRQILYAIVNPLGPVIDAWRRTALHGTMPDLQMLGIAAASSIVIFFIGFRVFKRLEASFADLL